MPCKLPIYRQLFTSKMAFYIRIMILLCSYFQNICRPRRLSPLKSQLGGLHPPCVSLFCTTADRQGKTVVFTKVVWHICLSFQFIFNLRILSGGELFSKNACLQGPLQLKYKYVLEKNKKVKNLNTKATFKNKIITFNFKKMKSKSLK